MFPNITFSHQILKLAQLAKSKSNLVTLSYSRLSFKLLKKLKFNTFSSDKSLTAILLWLPVFNNER
jgi:hypothetical protein